MLQRPIRTWTVSLARWAMLVPFLALSLISPAVMPGVAADGSMTLVLCSPDGPTTVEINLTTGKPVDRQPSVALECDWAAGHSATAEPAHPQFAVHLSPPTPARFLAAVASPVISPKTAKPEARAPPAA
jgi:hypothetical protein